VGRADQGVWRYGSWLPQVGVPVSLGEPTTPLVALEWDDLDVTVKLEGALPTGSFKDRGAAVLVSWLRAAGARAVVEDSSGNAGAALAAYCARAGIACEVYVPASAPATKLAQLRAHGATPVLVPGPRPAATDAVLRAVAAGAVYASHAWNPLYLAGTQTFAFELWEQLGTAPDVVVLPVGGGALLLGAFLGFRALLQAGRIARLPRLVAAQAAACAPLPPALRAGRAAPDPVEAHPSWADGIQVPAPLRGAEMLRAIRATGGTAVAVSEDAIRAAHARAARGGLLLERTAAVALAALGPGVAQPGERVVVAATGHGLKTAAL
jgi:threonine synthase